MSFNLMDVFGRSISRFLSFFGVRNSKSHLEYSGPYDSWESAVQNSVGYESEVVLEKVALAVRRVLSGHAAYERDGTCFSVKPEKDTLSQILENKAVSKSKIVDFGGSLGSSFISNRNLLQLREVEYIVIEQENFTHAGRDIANEFQLPILFESKLVNENLQDVDILVLSSVLQYLENYEEVIRQLISFKPKSVIIDRTPFIDGESQIFVQENNGYYQPKVSYPVRHLNEGSLIKCLTGYKVAMEWLSDFDPPNHKGFLLTSL